MMKKVMLILSCLFLSVGLIYSQTITVNGVVIDDAGIEVVGASVVVKGTTTGVATDIDGKFSLNVPSNSTLVFSLVGMKKKEMKATPSMNVVMESDAALLDEVVVTGYGIQKKATFTGSANIVGSKAVEELSITSMDKALQGNSPGLLTQASSGQPGAGQRIVIRGIGSINAGTEPLWVIDGVPVATGNFGKLTASGETEYSDNSNALAGINPADIETMTVLKDASATSIYGSRAANGVILVTTKAGREGKTQFSLNTNYGWSSRATKKFKVMNRDQYVDYLSDAMINSSVNEDMRGINNKDQALTYIKKSFPTFGDGELYDFDWMDNAYRTAAAYTLNFQANGGSASTKYFMSLGYLDQDGILEASSMQRVSSRINVSHAYSKKLRFGMNSTLSFQKNEVPLTTNSYYTNPIFAASVTPPVDPGVIDGQFTDLETVSSNFLMNIAYNEAKERTFRVLASAFAEYDIIDGLTFKALAGTDFLQLNGRQWDDPRVPGNTASNLGGRGSRTSTENLIWNSTNTFSYNKVFDEVHSLGVVVGQEVSDETMRSFEADGEGFPSSSLQELNAAAKPSRVFSEYEKTRLVSILSSANYGYDNRYMGSVSFRRDGSSRFSKDNKYSNFWSVGGQWRISQEQFMKSTESWLTNLGLRASYGSTGNSAIISRSTTKPYLDGRYPAIGIYRPGADYHGVPGIYPYQIKNEDLKWEKSYSFNLGLDFATFNNRLSGSFEFYNKKTSDLLFAKPISSTTGFTAWMQNIGAMQNRGVEFNLNFIPVITKNFEWSGNFNISHNKNKMMDLVDDEDIITGTRILRKGEDSQSIWTYKWAGVDAQDGAPMWYDKDGLTVKDYTKAEKQIVGSAAPKVFGSFSTTLKFFNFDVSAMLYFSLGNKISDQTLAMVNSFGGRSLFNQSTDLLDRWQNPGDITDVPKVVYGDSNRNPMSSRYVYDGSYWRLRNLNVGYTIPQVKGLRVYFQGTNLFTITDYKGLDPEVGVKGDPWFGYPVAKTVSFGLDYKF